MANRGVLAQCARNVPLPLEARDSIASCLELFNNVPATTRVLQEFCNNPFTDYELLVHPLAPDTRMVLQWICQERTRKRMWLIVSVHWQQWIHASEPWSVDLPTLTHTTNHVREVDIDARCAELCPAGVESCLAWAKKIWAAAVQGPCARCETPQRKRLRLMSTGLCARCSLARAIAG